MTIEAAVNMVCRCGLKCVKVMNSIPTKCPRCNAPFTEVFFANLGVIARNYHETSKNRQVMFVGIAKAEKFRKRLSDPEIPEQLRIRLLEEFDDLRVPIGEW